MTRGDAARLNMKRQSLAYLEAVMTDDPPQSDVLKRERLISEIAALAKTPNQEIEQ